MNLEQEKAYDEGYMAYAGFLETCGYATLKDMFWTMPEYLKGDDKWPLRRFYIKGWNDARGY